MEREPEEIRDDIARIEAMIQRGEGPLDALEKTFDHLWDELERVTDR
jgi:hypothetical protein